MPWRLRTQVCLALSTIIPMLPWSSTSVLCPFLFVAALVDAWSCHCHRLAASSSIQESTSESLIRALSSSKKCWNENKISGSNCRSNCLLKGNVYKIICTKISINSHQTSSSLASVVPTNRPWISTATTSRTPLPKSAQPQCPLFIRIITETTMVTTGSQTATHSQSNSSKSRTSRAATSNCRKRGSPRTFWEPSASSSEQQGRDEPHYTIFKWF